MLKRIDIQKLVTEERNLGHKAKLEYQKVLVNELSCRCDYKEGRLK